MNAQRAKTTFFVFKKRTSPGDDPVKLAKGSGSAVDGGSRSALTVRLACLTDDGSGKAWRNVGIPGPAALPIESTKSNFFTGRLGCMSERGIETSTVAWNTVLDETALGTAVLSRCTVRACCEAVKTHTTISVYPPSR